MDNRLLAKRIDRIEQQNRRLKIVIVVFGIALALPWVMGAVKDSRNQTIHGRRFILSDGKGKLRVFIGADEDEEGRVGLYLYDQLGKRSAAMYVKQGHSGLALYGHANQERARLDLGNQEVSLTFYDRNGRQGAKFSQGDLMSRIVLGGNETLGENDDPMGLIGRNTNVSLSFDKRESGVGMFSMGDQLSGSHIQLKTSHDGSHLLLRNQDNDVRVELAPAKDRPSIKLVASESTPGIAVIDGEGKVVSHLP